MATSTSTALDVYHYDDGTFQEIDIDLSNPDGGIMLTGLPPMELAINGKQDMLKTSNGSFMAQQMIVQVIAYIPMSQQLFYGSQKPEDYGCLVFVNTETSMPGFCILSRKHLKAWQAYVTGIAASRKNFKDVLTTLRMEGKPGKDKEGKPITFYTLGFTQAGHATFSKEKVDTFKRKCAELKIPLFIAPFTVSNEEHADFVENDRAQAGTIAGDPMSVFWATAKVMGIDPEKAAKILGQYRGDPKAALNGLAQNGAPRSPAGPSIVLSQAERENYLNTVEQYFAAITDKNPAYVRSEKESYIDINTMFDDEKLVKLYERLQAEYAALKVAGPVQPPLA